MAARGVLEFSLSVQGRGRRLGLSGPPVRRLLIGGWLAAVTLRQPSPLSRTLHNFVASANITHFLFLFLIISVLLEHKYCTLEATWESCFLVDLRSSVLASWLLSRHHLVAGAHRMAASYFPVPSLCLPPSPELSDPPNPSAR